DVFLGYPEHRHLWNAQKLARTLPGAAARLWYASRDLVPLAGPLRRLGHFLDYSTGGLGAVTTAHEGLPAYRCNGILGERLTAATLPCREIPWSLQAGREVVANFLAYDRRNRFVGEYMTKVDGATMYYAMEARSPFLDQELW